MTNRASEYESYLDGFYEKSGSYECDTQSVIDFVAIKNIPPDEFEYRYEMMTVGHQYRARRPTGRPQAYPAIPDPGRSPKLSAEIVWDQLVRVGGYSWTELIEAIKP